MQIIIKTTDNNTRVLSIAQRTRTRRRGLGGGRGLRRTRHKRVYKCLFGRHAQLWIPHKTLAHKVDKNGVVGPNSGGQWSTNQVREKREMLSGLGVGQGSGKT